MKLPNATLSWSIIGFSIATGILLYFFYRGAIGASPLELTGIVTAYFLFGFVVITMVYWIGKKNLQREVDPLKRQARSARLQKGFIKVLALYGTVFLIFIGMILFNHFLNKP